MVLPYAFMSGGSMSQQLVQVTVQYYNKPVK